MRTLLEGLTPIEGLRDREARLLNARYRWERQDLDGYNRPPVLTSPFILFVLAVLLLGADWSEVPPPAPQYRTVVLIGVDTLRADHLGLYGAKRPTSPTLDQIAERVRVFEHAYATAAWTTPSFASMLTGLGALQHGTGIRLGEV